MLDNYYYSSEKFKPFVFETETVHILSMDYGIEFDGIIINGCVVWENKSEDHGRILFYPKSNRLHRCDFNEWVTDGIGWIVSRMMKTNKSK